MPREPLTLCLSGGGFRAMLFHLGVVRSLRDLGLLPAVKHIFSVSGGSILAAHLVLNWERYISSNEDTFRECARELIDFAQHDVRGRILRRWLLLGWLRPWFNRTTQLGRHYNVLYKGALLANLAAAKRPALHVMATNMVNGEASFFDHQGIGRIAKGQVQRVVKAASARVADAVAASSAFPPMFPPLTLTARQLGQTGVTGPGTHRFTDGGVFDNTGVHAARCIAPTQRLLISDASAAFDQATDQAFSGVLARTIRTTDILMGRVADLEERQLTQARSKAPGNPPVTGHIGTVVEDADVRGVHPTPELQSPALQEWVKNVRTDLDKFPDAVIRAIYHHGYEVGLRMVGELRPGGQHIVLQNPWDPCSRTSAAADRRAETDRKFRQAMERLQRSLFGKEGDASPPVDARALAALKRAVHRKSGLWNARDPLSWCLLLALGAAIALGVCWQLRATRLAEESLTTRWQVIDVGSSGEHPALQQLEGVGLSPLIGSLTTEAHAYRAQKGSASPVVLKVVSSGPFAQRVTPVDLCSSANPDGYEMFASAALLVEDAGVTFGRTLRVERERANSLRLKLPIAPGGSTVAVMVAVVGQKTQPDVARLNDFLSNWRICDERDN